ncbi:MAG: ABC transporter permease [Christensenellales bacterium]|jgi:putative aldouronate transport system permease protein
MQAAKTWKHIRKWLACWQLYVMVLPALLYLILFAYRPMYGIQIAFKDYKMRAGVAGSAWVGFSNFRRLFSSYWFPVIIQNTLTLSVLSILIGFPMPIILALLVNEVGETKAQKTFQTISYAPHFITTVVLCGMITLFLSPSNGIINKAIEALGGTRVNFMQSAVAFKWIYVLSGVWQGMGWSSIIYVASLSGIDKSQIEAAEIDGASRFQKILHVSLPHIFPTIAILFILQCGTLLSVGYEKVYLLQTSPNLAGSEIVSTYVYKMGLEKSDFSFSTAVGLFNSVCNSLILIFANTLSKRVTEYSLF